MIPINELRIGNYVDLYGTIAMIQRADFNGVGIAVDKGEPIPLTEQWLKDFGFKIDDGCVVYYKKYIRQKYGYIVVNGKTFDTEVGASGYLAVTIKDCKVHQLQNLYFALTGLELTKQ